MTNGNRFVSVLLLVLMNWFFPSAFSTRQSALTLDLSDPLQAGKEITIDIELKTMKAGRPRSMEMEVNRTMR